ncbi:ParB N-terminal domain-containing protein [Trabulsiella odontotermitis]|uniref:IbrB-like domain-containing protein n=1 Tax=Trabulsiella odontotermitis TaxID=379893 RepID=UPI0024B6F2D7|nr:ParB/RepB/Spo0J family partition protein [Trabulsiella odontotermitis]WHP30129.1 ParB N-terminal domain-containing protein [Trabulsiella odontotermitis]
MQQQLIQQLEHYLDSLGEEERVEAINQFRLAIHRHSPFQDQPVDCVLWVKQETVAPNDYNPNNVAPPERRLLQKSLEADGFTQPVVVVSRGSQRFEIIDGFHRQELVKTKNVLKAQLKGYLPITCLHDNGQTSASGMASTIRHNRARGRHQINAMSDIIRELAQLGWSDEKISKELGMDSDEVLRLKQISGLLELFADRHFSGAWTVK